MAAAEILINTAAVADNIRDIEKALNIPDLIAEGTVSYGMQSFDQSLMKWYQDGAISLRERAVLLDQSRASSRCGSPASARRPTGPSATWTARPARGDAVGFTP